MTDLSATAADILQCARKLVIAGGYNGFSYADIAAEIGIRKASIHYHFPSKVDLMRTLVERYREDALSGLAEMERLHPDPVKLLRAYTGFWAACIGNMTMPFCACALLASEMPLLPPEVALEVKAYFRALSAWLTAVLERGAKQNELFLSGSARAEAEAFLATLHGAMLSARAYEDPAIFAAITEPLIKRLAAPRRK